MPPAFNLSQDQTLQLRFVDRETASGPAGSATKVDPDTRSKKRAGHRRTPGGATALVEWLDSTRVLTSFGHRPVERTDGRHEGCVSRPAGVKSDQPGSCCRPPDPVEASCCRSHPRGINPTVHLPKTRRPRRVMAPVKDGRDSVAGLNRRTCQRHIRSRPLSRERSILETPHALSTRSAAAWTTFF